MAYRALPPQLHATGDAVQQFCSDQWGIGRGKIRIETPVAPDVEFVPTISATTPEFYTLCIEVSTRAYNSTLDAFVLDCKNRGLAIKLYVAIPKDGTEGDFKSDFSRARSSGVGLLEVSAAGVTILHDALALSLTGVRTCDPRTFPAKYRQSLSDASQQFIAGSPAKAASTVYDEVEQLTRRLVKKASAKGWWKGGRTPAFDPEKEAWSNVLSFLMANLNATAAGCPNLKQPLFARALGVTEHRNDSGHKPNTVAKIQKRDLELRTRFESAIDLLRDFVEATRPLKI